MIKVPYFFTLGPHRDLTCGAIYLLQDTQTLDRALPARPSAAAGLNSTAPIPAMTCSPGEDRGYIFRRRHSSACRAAFRLTFDVKAVSDDAYLEDYGLPDLDRLRSEAVLSRAKRDSLFRTSLTHYKTLRTSEEPSQTSPLASPRPIYQTRHFPALTGGELRLTLQGHGHRRSSSLDGTATDSNGRDLARLTADIDWRRSWRLGGMAILAEWEAWSRS